MLYTIKTERVDIMYDNWDHMRRHVRLAGDGKDCGGRSFEHAVEASAFVRGLELAFRLGGHSVSLDDETVPVFDGDE